MDYVSGHPVVEMPEARSNQAKPFECRTAEESPV